MKKRFKSDNLFVAVLFALLLGIACVSCNRTATTNAEASRIDSATKSHDVYYCPMHPDVIQDHPGKCPKPECDGMALVRKPAEDFLHTALKPVNASVLSNIKTMHPEEKAIQGLIEAQGYIDYDNRTKHNIASQFSGRIEKLYLRYNYQPVKTGDPVFDIYSPELVTAQENLLFLLNSGSSENSLIEAAEQRLKLLGFTQEQTASIKQSHKIKTTVTVYSQWDGHIHDIMNSATSLENAGKNISSELQLKEGMYIKAGETVFNIVDPHKAVIILQVKTSDIRKVKLHQEVDFHVDESPDMVMQGKVDFIDPFMQPGAKTCNVRVDLYNKAHVHKVGTLIKAIIRTDKVEGIWVQTKSILDLGREKIVWLKNNGAFISHPIETGAYSNGWVEVVEGLKLTDEIAEDASYLIDSENFVKISDDE